jgi:hypothetical protein
MKAQFTLMRTIGILLIFGVISLIFLFTGGKAETESVSAQSEVEENL